MNGQYPLYFIKWYFEYYFSMLIYDYSPARWVVVVRKRS